MRQAKSGGLLIEVRGDQNRFEAVRVEVARSTQGPYQGVYFVRRPNIVLTYDGSYILYSYTNMISYFL